MNRTKGIFIAASILAGLALVLALRQPAGSHTTTVTAPPPDPSATSKAVSLGGRVSHPFVLGSEATDVFVQVDLRGRTGSEVQRLPLSVALVIDRSGSMAGRKLTQAKLAARRLVEALAEGDRVAIITYGSDVTTLVPSTRIDAASRSHVLSRIDTILDRGGTFLSGGLQAAIEALRPTMSRDQVTRVILISDGQANEGITTKHGLVRLARQTAGKGISVTSMGVGLDFNEDVMTAIAEHGNGHYYFINDPNTLAGIFKRELSKLIATVARRPELHIDLQPGVELLALYGYEYDKAGSRIAISLPDVFAKQHRRITLKLRISPQASKASTSRRPLLRTELSYLDGKHGGRRALVNAIDVQVTLDRALVERHVRREVLARAQQVELARDVRSALDTYGAGDVVGARARLQQRLRKVMKANTSLRSKDLDRSIVRVRRLLGATNAAPSSAAGRATIKAGKAEAYHLAK